MAALLLIPFRLLMPWIVPALYGDPHAGRASRLAVSAARAAPNLK